MRRALLATTGLAWLALTGAASAAVTVVEGPADPQYFAPEAAGQNNFTLGGITWSLVMGSAATEKGSVAGLYAAPQGMGSSTTTGTTYMAVEAGGVEQAVWSTPQTKLSIYWGSIDSAAGDGITNQIAITIDGYTLTGAELVALATPTHPLGEGQQTNPLDNQLVTITGLGPFTTVQFSDSGKNAFEFSLGTVPEPSTWTMLALGFAGLGYAAFRRNSKKGQMAGAI
jgi:PEP-CTERM motif